ncbi:MAG: cation diffusion facilitator family transporter [Acidobacteriota bacterium]
MSRNSQHNDDHRVDHCPDPVAGRHIGHHDHRHEHSGGSGGRKESAHAHHHHHHHLDLSRLSAQRVLLVVLVLTSAYLIAEAIAGYLANSLALLSDAGHMFSDVAALGLSWLAMRFATRPATVRKTYGLQRLEILAALINGITLIALSIFIVVEAWHRFAVQEVVKGELLMYVSLGGLAVNLVSAWLLAREGHGNLNVRGAFLHVIGDLLGSLAAVLAGGLIVWKGWYWADPLFSLLISGLIVINSWRLVAEAVNILLEGTPSHIDAREVEQALREVAGVQGIHDLHIWTITSGRHAVTAHVVVREASESRRILREMQALLSARFELTHSTIQIEDPTFSTVVDLNARRAGQ